MLTRSSGRWLVVLALAAGAPAGAQGSSPGAGDPVKITIQEVVAPHLHAAARKVRQNTKVDLAKGSYDARWRGEPVSVRVSDEARRELRRLSMEHDRKIAHLQWELQRKLRHATAEFEREATGDNFGSLAERRAGLRHKVQEAYQHFEQSLGEENARADEKRAKIFKGP